MSLKRIKLKLRILKLSIYPKGIEGSHAKVFAFLLKFADDIEGITPLFSRTQIYLKGLSWSLNRKWLILSLAFSRLVDFHRARFIQALNQLNNDYAPASDPSSDIERAAARLQKAVLTSLNTHSSLLRNSSTSQTLADMIISKYSPTRFLNHTAQIKGAPGSHLRSLAQFLFSHRTYSAIFEPTLRDLLDEYCEALASNHPRKAIWIRIRGYVSFWSAVFAQLPISTVKMVYKLWIATR